MPIPTAAVWAACLPSDVAAAMARFRSSPQLFGCDAGSQLWIVGCQTADDLAQQMRQTTGAELFTVSADHAVTPWGCRVPVGRLPDGPWGPLCELLAPAFARAGFAPRHRPHCDLTLIRSDRMAAATMMEIELPRWLNFVCRTPQIRLSKWEFAASSTGRVLVRGDPLPAVPGPRYWQSAGLVIPVGFHWFPQVAATTVRKLLRLLPDELALWSAETGHWERMKDEAFVPARRENVHQTVRERAAVEEST